MARGTRKISGTKNAILTLATARIDMRSYKGETLSWELIDGCIELTLHREPCNEIGLRTLEEFEKFLVAHDTLKEEAHALIITSSMTAGFCAGADLRDLYFQANEIGFDNAAPR